MILLTWIMGAACVIMMTKYHKLSVNWMCTFKKKHIYFDGLSPGNLQPIDHLIRITKCCYSFVNDYIWSLDTYPDNTYYIKLESVVSGVH